MNGRILRRQAGQRCFRPQLEWLESRTLLAPLADAGQDLEVARGDLVTLQGLAAGSASPASFLWQQISGPDVTGGGGQFSGASPTFIAPSRVVTLEFDLYASDVTGISTPDRVAVFVNYEHGDILFVSPLGSDSSSGTRSAPLATLPTAIGKAASTAADLYVAAGIYDGAIQLASGVSIFGGYDATTWLRDPLNLETRITGGTRPVVGADVFDIVLDGLTIEAADATTPGESSYGIVLVNAQGVRLQNNFVMAGAGAAGSAGADGGVGQNGGNGGQGNVGCENSVGPCSSCSQPQGGLAGASPVNAIGGVGGLPGLGNAPGQAGGTGFGNTKGGSGAPSSTANGQAGMDGASGSPGAGGTGGSLFGSFVGGVYVPATGTAGEKGASGNGGGGGGGGGGGMQDCESYGSSGGGGGGGAEGGAPGQGGGGGGGSFGLVLIDFDGSITDTNVLAGNGGAGGRGGDGGAGGMGGAGGSGGPHGGAGGQDDGGNGAPGGKGGNGGAGGAGGGGGGGPSLGIFAQNSFSVSVNSSFSAGEAGQGGAGGANAAGGVGASGSRGAAGASSGLPAGNSPLAVRLTAGPVYENRPAGTLVGKLSVINGPPNAPYTFSLVEGMGDDNNASYEIQGDELVIVHPVDYETRQIQRLRVRATDGSTTIERLLSIVIQNNNDPPRCNIPALTSAADSSGPVTLSGFVSACTAGEMNQFVETSFATDDTSLFTTPPSIDASGTLTFDPAPNVRGRATITVTIQDTGGTANFGVDTTTMQFTIEIDKPHPWQNGRRRLDVTDDDFVVAGDALSIINYINAFGAGELPDRSALVPPYYDTDGDDFIAAGDALDVINELNARPASQGGAAESEGQSLAMPPSYAAIMDALAADLSLSWLAVKRMRR